MHTLLALFTPLLVLQASPTLSAPVNDALVRAVKWCPVIPHPVYTYVWPWKGEEDLPAGHLVWICVDPNFLHNDDDAPPVNDKRKARAIDSEPVQSRDLVVRAGSRDFEAKNYREIAQQAGIMMIHTVAGLIANVVDFAAHLQGAVWAGDHVFELAMLQHFLNDHPYLSEVIHSCQPIEDRFTGILNSHANLIGVDAVLNNMKSLLLQRNGPANWGTYPQGVINAMQHYFDLIQANYEGVVDRLVTALDQVAEDVGLNPVGAEFRAYALGRFQAALALLRPHVNFNAQGMQGGRFEPRNIR